jgi:hypothetical protein
VAGESENWGPEQERRNNVIAARLRITTLRAASGPGVELLEYLTRGPFVSPEVVRLRDRVLGFSAGFLARDPGGHALRVTGLEGTR